MSITFITYSKSPLPAIAGHPPGYYSTYICIHWQMELVSAHGTIACSLGFVLPNITLPLCVCARVLSLCCKGNDALFLMLGLVISHHTSAHTHCTCGSSCTMPASRWLPKCSVRLAFSSPLHNNTWFQSSWFQEQLVSEQCAFVLLLSACLALIFFNTRFHYIFK